MITLPSKKVLSAFIIIAALVVAVIIAFGRDTSSQAINLANNLVAGDKVSIPDNPNWQNELSGVSRNATSTQTEDANQSDGSNLTDTISTTLMSNLMAMNQSGSLDDTSAQILINQSINYIGENNQTLLITQLNTIPDNGSQSIADYGENLGMVFKTNSPQEAKQELDIFAQALQSNDPSKIAELDSVIAVYQNIAYQLEKMPVPETFFKAHLDMTNGMIGLASSVAEMKLVFSDPVKSLAALQLYQNSSNTFTQALKATQGFIKQNNIAYKQGSGGYYLLYGL